VKKISWWLWRFGKYLTIILMDYVEPILEASTKCAPLRNVQME